MARTPPPAPSRPAVDSQDDLIARLAREADRIGPPARDIRHERRAYEAHVADRLSGHTPTLTSSTLEQARLQKMLDLADRSDARGRERRYASPTALAALLFCILLLVIALAIRAME